MRGGRGFFLLVFASSCLSYANASHEEIVQGLSDAAPIARRNAADAMRKNRSFGNDGVPALLHAAEVETNTPALGAEMIALGSSGSPDAQPLICHYLKSTNPDLQRWANKAFYLWFPQNSDRKGCDK